MEQASLLLSKNGTVTIGRICDWANLGCFLCFFNLTTPSELPRWETRLIRWIPGPGRRGLLAGFLRTGGATIRR